MEKETLDIKIALVTHRSFEIPKNKYLIPIHAGRAIAESVSKDGVINSEELEWLCKNTLADSTGDNISDKNRSYCELTALYWLWKNQRADYMGLCHYRRYFAFKQNLSDVFCSDERNNGCLSVSRLNEENILKYGLSEEALYNGISGYDAVFIKPIDLYKNGIKSNYDAMKACPEYHIMKDVDNMIRVIKDKYPDMSEIVDQYMFKYRYNYLYNCFVMKSDIFDRFCNWLFDILGEMEHYVDTKNYSLKQLRVYGLLAERLLGIWILWLKSQHKYNLKEVPLLFVENVAVIPDIKPAFDRHSIAIVSNFDDNYASVFDVFLKSALAHVSEDYNYDFIILSKDITPSNKSLLLRNQEKFKNVSIRFIDPSWSLDGLDLFVNQDVYTIDLYYRVVIPHILKNYTKVLVVDADMICRDDLKDLFNTDVSDFLAAGIKDTVFQGQVNGLEPDRVIYTHNYMKMDNAYDYVNTGVLLFNCEKYREKYSLNYLRDFIKKNISKVIVFEQDMLNMLLYKNIKFLDAKWNIYTKSNDWVKERITASPAYSYVNYMRVRDKGNGIVHYANSPKPWQDPKTDFACLWWSYAKQSPYYESFIYDKSKSNYLLKILDVVNWNKNILKYWKYKFLQNFVVGKTKTRYLNKKYYYKARIKNARELIKNS